MLILLGLAAFAALLLVLKQPAGRRFTYVIAIIVRLAWSLTIGLPFFAAGLVAFLLLDILFPSSNNGYVVLNRMYRWGSCYWFAGLRLNVETHHYDVAVEKQPRPGTS